MKSRRLFAALVCAWAAPLAHATTVGLDLAGAFNGGAAVFGDSFEDNVFDTPPWIVAEGTPGPESGTHLTMHNGDTIFAGVPINREFSAEAFAVAYLPSFGPGSSMTLLFLGEAPGDIATLSFFSGGLGIFGDETGPLSFVSVPDNVDVTLEILWTPAGNVTATINNVEIFNGPNNFSAASAIGVSVAPEPATLSLLLAGAFPLLRRRH